MRAGLPANTGEAGAMHRVAFFAGGWLADDYARLPNHRPCNNSTAWSNTANGSAAL